MELRSLNIGKITIAPKWLLRLALFIIGTGIGITAALPDIKIIVLLVCLMVGVSILVFAFSGRSSS